MELGSWQVTEEWGRRYLKVVADDRPEYMEAGMAPPLGLIAWALGSLLERLALPPGAIHSLQELETLGPVQWGEVISATASIDGPKRRGGLEVIHASYSLKDGSGRPVLKGRSTVLNIGPGAASPVHSVPPQDPRLWPTDLPRLPPPRPAPPSPPASWAPLASARAGTSSSTITSRVAQAAAMETGFPPNVENVLASQDAAISGLVIVAPTGAPLAMPLAMTMMSGSTPQCSIANQRPPVRPNPDWTSSAIKRPPYDRMIYAARAK